jgi:hypothetical protein
MTTFSTERDYDDEGEEPEDKKGKGKKSDDEGEVEKIPDCTLHPEVMALCQIIFSSKSVHFKINSAISFMLNLTDSWMRLCLR